MEASPWQRRIHRAQELAGQRTFAAEILGFYVRVARFQEGMHRCLTAVFPGESPSPSSYREICRDELSQLTSQFESFLSLTEEHGPQQLAELSRELRARGQSVWAELLNEAWSAYSPSDAQGFLALAFLQPYAELLRSRISPGANRSHSALCPYCNRKPGFGLLRQMGDGAARSLVCSFCFAEWEFRRLVCPGCGEEDDRKLPVFTASDFECIRVECCDACKTYIKTIDLTKDGHAEPAVDELASAPLDVWVHGHGYAKLQRNLLGM
jgi:formate dehydrogenase accessory protein FdhE